MAQSCAITLKTTTKSITQVRRDQKVMEAQPAQAGNCSTVSVTAGGLTLVIAGNRSKRSLEQYILKNNLPLGLLTTSCTGAGLGGCARRAPAPQ